MNTISAIFFIFLCIFWPPLSESKVCQTEVCKVLGNELKVSIDQQMDPCTDFSSHICGNFEKIYSISPGEVRYTVMGAIEEDIKKELKHLLEMQPLANHSRPQTKAAIFYNSCLNMTQRNLHGKPAILGLVQNVTKGKDYEENLRRLLETGLTTRMVSVVATQDPINPQYNIFSIEKPSLVLSEGTLRSPDSEKEKEQIKNYKKYMNSVLDHLGIWASEKNFIDEIIKLHIKVAQGLPSIEDQSNPGKYSNKISIKYLQNKCPQVSWKALINGVLKNTGKQFTDEDVIMVFSLNYTDALCSILKEYQSDSLKKQVLEMDLKWALISAVASLGSDALLEASQQLKKDLFGVTGKPDLWKTCLEITSETLVDIIGNLYVKEKFQASKKKDIEFMINNIKTTFKTVLEKITWMDPMTKHAALDKLNSIKTKIGYPDSLLSEEKLAKDNEKVFMHKDKFIENYVKYQAMDFIKRIKEVGEKIPDDKWMMGTHEVNAYYNPPSNEIVFPAAILRYPIYDINLPITYNYGSIGMVFAHEILHGFDTSGSMYDSIGMLREWWTKQSRAEYMNKTKCIVNQYGQYSIYNESLPSQQTLGEDIADNAGLRMAYLASHGETEKREKQRLPEINYDEEQLFFVAHARTWCSIYTKNALLEKMKSDVHSVWKYRINGPISNMPEFAKLFKCDRNKAMNRLKKCLIW